MIRRIVAFLIVSFFLLPPMRLRSEEPIRVRIYDNKPMVFSTADGKVEVFCIDVLEYVAAKEEWRLGHGTTFTLYLPALVLPGLTPESSKEVQLTPGQGETILVVEDDVIARAAIAEILEDLGYRVLAAANGKEALEKFESHVALVLSDLVMPHMGGGDLYASLREKHPNLKMIVITGYPMNDEGRALLERGITGWIKKPFVPAELAEIVRAALE